MELRGHDDDSDGDDFLPHHRRLGLGRLYQEGDLGGMPISSSAATPSLNYNNPGILASGSAFRRPPIFPSPLSSTAQLPPSATFPSSHEQPPLSHQPQPLLTSQGGGRESASVVGDDSQKSAPPVQLPSSLDPKLSLVGDRTQERQQQQPQPQPQLREAPKNHSDAASPTSFSATDGAPLAEGGGGLPSSSKTDAAAALTKTSRTWPSSAAASGTGASARYRECLKNHAASVGGHVLDGCGEFMPGGEEGTPEALKCAACACHRSFHRREVEGGVESEGLFLPVSSASPPRGVQHGDCRGYYLPNMGVGNGAYPGGLARGGGLSSNRARNLHNPPPLSLQTPFSRRRQREHPRVGLLPPSSGAAFAPRSGGTAFGGGEDDENTNYSGGTTTTESSSEERQAHMLALAATSFHYGAPPAQALQTQPPAGAGASQQQHPHYEVAGASSGSTKKRFRSKFTAQQKEIMAEFAERMGWRMQKQDDAAVEKFCREAGVSRQVFKVWMHNNKHALLKSKQQQQPDQGAPPPLPPPPPPPQQQQQPQSSSSS